MRKVLALLGALVFMCTSLLTLWGIAPAAMGVLVAALAEEGPMEDADPEEAVSLQERGQEDAEIAALVQDPDTDIRAKLDRIFARYATMGASIAVIQNGEITFLHTYGFRQKGGPPVTEDTLFQVGSIGKMVAGIGIMRLLEDGCATLDTDLGDILGFPVRNPEYPLEPITLRQVMSHTAGLRDNGYYNAALQGDPRPLSQLFRGNCLQYVFLPDAKPGHSQRYSNFGGGIAGSLIEKMSGQTVDSYLQAQVFAPLHITAAYQYSLLPQGAKVADMYAMPSKRSTKVLSSDLTHVTEADPEQHYFLTAGKLIISAPDLAKLLIALCDGGVCGDARILRESSVREMRTLQNDRGSVYGASGRGLFMNIIDDDQVEGRRMYGHGGKANGMLCAAYFDPTDRTGVVMLTNGCNNKKVYNDVGMLGRAVLTFIYKDLLAGSHVPEDPWLVEE